MQRILSFEQFKVELAKGVITPEIEYYLNFLQQLHANQFYLNEGAFNIFQKHRNLCNNLANLDSSILNPAQKRTVELYNQNVEIKNITSPVANDEGGTTLKYINPNGFISITAIVLSTITAGIAIAAIFISRL